jgi:hypothetical protein
MDMRFDTWSVRSTSLYRAGSLRQGQKKYQNISYIYCEYRRPNGAEVALNEQANIHFSVERGVRVMTGTGCFVHKRMISAVKRVEFISDTIPYIILRGRWCYVILNVHVPTEDKSDHIKDRFYEN